jgi:hypothetical protein
MLMFGCSYNPSKKLRPLPRRLIAAAKIAQACGEQLSVVINDILDHSRLEEGKV